MERGGGGNKWKILRERLSIKGMTCCGGGVRRSSNMIVRDDDHDEEVIVELNLPAGETLPGTTDQHNQACMMGSGQIPAAPASGMNLATALAAERQFRAHHEWVGDNENTTTSNTNTAAAAAAAAAIASISTSTTPPIVNPNVISTVITSPTPTATTPRTPLRVSLMALLEEGEEGDDGGEKEMRLCCVCMGRRKGAAFIPCGHTFCRVCSRELWLNRGSCPLCNRSILEILDIF